MCARLLLVGLSVATALVLPPASTGLTRPAATSRHAAPACKAVTFEARNEASSPKFSASRKQLSAWIKSGEALPILFSQADSCSKVGERDGKEVWDVCTPIAFPGMTARSVTTIVADIDAAAPALSLTSGESRTEAEGAPAWVIKLFAAIAASTVTETTNRVEFRDVGGEVQAFSTVGLTVRLNLPGWIPVPVAQVEKGGNDSLQKVLEKDMPPTLAKFSAGYLEWAAQQAKV